MIDRFDEFEATALLSDPIELRRRADRDGFLCFKKLIPPEEILDLRRQVLTVVKDAGFLKTPSELMDGIANVEALADFKAFMGTSLTREVYAAVQSLPAFHRLAHHPNLIKLYETLFGETVLVHPRNIMRLVVPAENSHPTPPHQDHIYINGTTRTWTSWIPLGDCPMSIGSLAMLPHSHTLGLLPVRAAKGAGGMESLTDAPDRDWAYFDYSVGDVIAFPALTVHKSTPTSQPERIRISVDCRYQPLSEPVHGVSLLPHAQILGWEQIYEGWHDDDDLKYYWKSLELTIDDTRCLQKNPQLRQR